MSWKIFAVAVASFLLGSACIPSAHAFQSKLPDPYAPTPKSTTIPVATSPQKISDLPSPTVARSMAAEALQGLNSLVSTFDNDAKHIQGLKAQIRNCDERVNMLIAAKNAALDELRKGLYCSQCHRTKTEIERDGENFWDHLRRVNGHPIPASQAELDAKAKEFDQQITALSTQMEAEKRQYQAQIRQLQDEMQHATDQIQQGIYLWETATSFEHDLINAIEAGEKQRAQAAIDFAARHLHDAEAGRSRLVQQGADKLSLDEASLACKVWQQAREKAQEEASNRWSSYLADLKNADETKTKEFVQIRTLLASIDATPNFLPVMPTFSATVDRVSFNVSPTQMGAEFRFGKLASSGFTYEDNYDKSGVTEARAFIQLIGRVRLSAVWRTEYTPDGVLSYPTMDLGLKPPSEDKKVNDTNQQKQTKSGLPIP